MNSILVFIVKSTEKYGVEFIKVNPAYTTKIAKQKYCNQRKLNTHIGASYVIARRGQGFKDRLLAYWRIVTPEISFDFFEILFCGISEKP